MTPEQSENVTKWVAALRSGEYEQTRNACLSDDEGYCCLGVAGKVLGMSDKILSKGTHYSLNYDVIKHEMGLKDSLGVYLDYFNEKQALYVHNDTEGLTFAEIAEIIETNRGELFE